MNKSLKIHINPSNKHKLGNLGISTITVVDGNRVIARCQDWLDLKPTSIMQLAFAIEDDRLRKQLFRAIINYLS
jgi:hypothetical protein